jgi:hypothetical protein
LLVSFMSRFSKLRQAPVLFTSATRVLAAGLLLVMSTVASGAAPAPTWTLSNESEAPLEADETSLEIALPSREEFDACREGRRHGDSKQAPVGCGAQARCLPQRLMAVVGHRLWNGIPAPLRC